ncbi:TrbI/VirB10 family protein [uncultured Ruegeria sp.]|uniref:TrbI/VirB10 family protein n=1 Tax=uncultured Ruegeria sp. TaxID=259304 RepID=UPI00262B3242|nr:TrbI/VirB10 family protein [uncultured Ruegeria sp.]
MQVCLCALAIALFASAAAAQYTDRAGRSYEPYYTDGSSGGSYPARSAPPPQAQFERAPASQRDVSENKNTTWQNNLVTEFPPIVGATTINDPSKTLTQGTVIEAVFGGSVSSELPGSVVATLSRGVYSMDGTRLLLPRGSRLYGEYRADTELAQTRIMIVWSRVITPDGFSAQIASGGTDAQGRSGATGRVDTHFGARFGTAALLSVIGIAPVALVSDSDTENSVQNDLATQVGSDLRNSTASALEDYLRITPTIHINQGSRINAILQRDVVFDAL